MFSLQTFDLRHLFDVLDSFVAFTSDAGVEVKITEYQIDRTQPQKLMSHFLADRVNRAPLKVEEDSDEEEAFDPGKYFARCGGQQVFRNAFAIPGVGHSIHNIVKGLPKELPHYGKFFEQCKLVELLLHHPGRNERLVATCFTNTPFADFSAEIRNFSWTLYEDRWGCVAAFAGAIVKPLALLRVAWSQREYEGVGRAALQEREWSDGGPKFQPEYFTRLLKDPVFWAYHRMIIKLHSIPKRCFCSRFPGP